MRNIYKRYQRDSNTRFAERISHRVTTIYFTQRSITIRLTQEISSHKKNKLNGFLHS